MHADMLVKSCVHYKPWPSLGQGKVIVARLHNFFETSSLWPRILLLILCIFMCCDVVRWLSANPSLWTHVAMKIRPRPGPKVLTFPQA